MKVYFAAWNPYDVIYLAGEKVKNTIIPYSMASKYCKQDEVLARFQATFPNVGIFTTETLSENAYSKVISKIGDFVIDNGLMNRLNFSMTSTTDENNESIFIRPNPLRELDEQQLFKETVRAIKNIKKAGHYKVYLIGHFNMVLDLDKYNALPHGLLIYDWMTNIVNKKVLAYDHRNNETEVIDFRTKGNFDFEHTSFDDMATLRKYQNLYSTEAFSTEGIDTNGLVWLQFEWYYKPILRKLNIADDSFI